VTEANNNPLLATEGLPSFAKIEPSHVAPAVQLRLKEALTKLEAVEQSAGPTWESTIGALEELDQPFEHAWEPVGHLFGVKNSPELREAYEGVLPQVVEFGLRARQSQPIYQALKGLAGSPEWSQLSEAQQRIVTDRIRDAELAGIGLTGTARERFNAIEQELSQISTEFSNHVLDATKAFGLDITHVQDAEGWPETLRHMAAQAWNKAHADTPTATPEAGPWRITLETSLYIPFMEHCRNRDLREQVYRGFITRAAQAPFDNSGLIPKILQLKQEQAKLLGFANFAAVSLSRKMAGKAEAVRDMFTKLRTASWTAAERDLADLKAMKDSRGDTTPLALWDIPFWAERLREQRFDYTDEELRPYFPFEKVLAGLFRLMHRLFGVTVQPATGQISVWNDDVRYYHILDESKKPIAAFFLDPYSRPENKRSGAWMDSCLGRRRLADGRTQLPVAHLVCNQTPPMGDKPSLMSFGEVETLFHEMGHGLQHMLTKVELADAAGIRGVEWDAVELPSQFMENWCYHKPTLLAMTGHYQTNDPLPDELFDKVYASRTYRAGTMMLRQLMLGMTDLELHSDYDPQGAESPFDVQRRIAQLTSLLPLLPEDRFLCSFQHIFSGGYSAGYYSYKWAEILSADAFAAFEEAGLDNDAAVMETGRRFRDTVLALGGGKHPLEVFRAFRGREPSVEPLLRHSGLI